LSPGGALRQLNAGCGQGLSCRGESGFQLGDHGVGGDTVAVLARAGNRGKPTPHELGFGLAANDLVADGLLDQRRQGLARLQRRIQFGAELGRDAHGRDGGGFHGR